MKVPKARIGMFARGTMIEGAICVSEVCSEINSQSYEAYYYADDFGKDFPNELRRSFEVDQLSDVCWWRQQNLDLASFYGVRTFPPKVLQAARNAGTIVVIECDSDGYVSPNQDGIRYLRLRLNHELPLIHQLRSLKAGLDELRNSRKIIQRLVENFSIAHWIKIESEMPAAKLREFLRAQQHSDLIKKIVVIPFAVRNRFLEQPIQPNRENRIIAAGRLGASQKNPHAMMRLIERIGTQLPNVPFELHIRGNALAFESHMNRWGNISFHFDSSIDFLASRLHQSQILVSTSRWETTPVQGIEALCCGCTLVAPEDVLGYASLVENGNFGGLYKSTNGCVTAIRKELSLWESGNRNPITISNHWRKRCSASTIANSFLGLATDTK